MYANLFGSLMFAYIPHDHCYFWNSNLLLLHAPADGLIALAYFSIPCTLAYFVFKRKDRPSPFLNDAFEFALIGMALVTPEGNWIKVNPALCELVGYTESELLQTNFREITYPEDLAADQQYVNQLISGEVKACHFEKRYIHKQGHIIWSLLSVSLVRNSQGQPLNFVVQIQDISVRKQAEQLLQSTNDQLEQAVKERTRELEKANAQSKASAAQYQDLYDNAPDMYMSINAKSMKIVRCNRTLINELGYRKKEVLGRPIVALYHPICIPGVEKTFQSFMATGEVKDAQLVLQRKDGSPLEVSLNLRALRDKVGNILYGRSSCRDITDRKQLETQLQQINAELEQRVQDRTQALQVLNYSLQKNRERLELALAASGDSWWHWQVQTGELDWSPEFYRMLGYEDGELSTSYETWQSLIHPDDRSWVKETLNAYFEDDSTSYTFDYRVRAKTGGWKWITSLGKVVERDVQGEPLRMAGMHHDISDRKQAEQQLQQVNTELTRSNQELSQFAYVASHDLQEPLRKIRSFTELLASRYGGDLDETGDRYIRYITSGATRMQGLIDDLLSYSRVGRTDLNIQSTSLMTILQQVKFDLETVITDRNAIITVEALPTLPVDPVQMKQVLQNLIANAIKYCQADVPTIRVWATRTKAKWTISIQDNGIGIDPQFSERIFVIFQRLHNRSDYSGTGIGLAICKKIVERHGGQIWVNSQEGQGATFSFSLPISCPLGTSLD